MKWTTLGEVAKKNCSFKLDFECILKLVPEARNLLSGVAARANSVGKSLEIYVYETDNIDFEAYTCGYDPKCILSNFSPTVPLKNCQVL